MSKLKKILSVLFIAITIISSLSVIGYAASWPGFSKSVPIKVFPVSTGNNTPGYSNSALSTKYGTIYAADEVYIYSISKTNGRYAAYCSWPVSSGRKYGYAALSSFTSASAPTEVITAKSGCTTYRRSNLSQSYGSVSAGDKVYKLGTSGNSVQILYNIGTASSPSSYKMAWVTASSYNTMKGSSSSGTIRSNVSNSPVTCNASSGNLPAAASTFYKGSKVYFNFQVSSNLYVKKASLYLKDEKSGYKCVKTFTAQNYTRYESCDCTFSEAGTYKCFWIITFTNGSSKNLSVLNFTVKNTTAPNNKKSISLNVPLYKQGDSRWSGTMIGTKTIGQVGCTTCCFAMCYSYNKKVTCYPNEMRRKLSYGGSNGNDLVWSSISNAGLTRSASYNCNMTTEMLKTIYSKLASGKPVIVGCNAGKGNNSHWVVVKSFNGNPSSPSAGNFGINDPGGYGHTTLDQFLNTHGTVFCFVW